MYNRDIPRSGGYDRIPMEDAPSSQGRESFRQDRRPPPAGGPAGGGQGNWLTGLLKGLGLEELDRGDILLLLILLFLLLHHHLYIQFSVSAIFLRPKSQLI